ncbi:MAG: hypothetical protein OEZ10_11035 [Gammaproteobacteria bacterium]|nr:hypothetical protein [Gammaproteobacteria bacterium]
MADLKIRVYKNGNAEPDSTVTIPGGIIKTAAKLMPRVATDAMAEKGIDMDEIAKLAANPDLHDTLVEVEDHKKGERVVISLE